VLCLPVDRVNAPPGSPPLPPPAPFAADLLRWYDSAAIRLPWRGTPDPYRVWLSEVMLQQTQISAVIPYFERFLAHFPTVAALAAAPTDSVLKQWEGLGYYSRARNLQRAAQQIMTAYGGVFPQTVEGLLTLPGIGRYTAGAIASIAFGVRAAVVDGNVIRVLARVLDLADDVTKGPTQARLWQAAEGLLPPERVGDYNQALMDLGRTICTARNPLCGRCPIRDHCRAFAAGTQAERPVKAKKAAVPHRDVAAGVIYNAEGAILIAQRPADGLLGGLWEFPGGKQEPGETLIECLRRELREELAIEVTAIEPLVKVQHAFTHFKITLHAFTCQHSGGEPQAIGCQAFRWVRLAAMREFAFGKADLDVIRFLQGAGDRLL
jgi:A/G-specific adenine glycosylase